MMTEADNARDVEREEGGDEAARGFGRGRAILVAAGLVLAAALVAFIALVVWPHLRVRSVVREVSTGRYMEPAAIDEAIERLGGAERAVERLRGYLRAPAKYAPNRPGAAWLLGRCGVGAADALVECLADADAEVRETAAMALGALGAPAKNTKDAESALERALKDENAEVRAAAARALKRVRAAP